MSDNNRRNEPSDGRDSNEDEKHPVAEHADQLAWAIWVGESLDDSEIFAVVADSERRARNKALNRAENGGEVVTVDGPFANSDPGVWEFEYITEHRETIVVEAPNQDYAAETADSERDHRGELIQTTHTESRRLDVDPNED